MDKLLLVRASSRLGMKYIPIGGTVLNLGVEHGVEAILSNDFVQKISRQYSIDSLEYNFSKPEDIADEEYYNILAKETNNLAENIFKKLNSSEYKCVLTVGGDHSVSLASVLGIFRFLKGKKVKMIDFDSHGDIHMTKTSPTGNFHGMWIRPLLDKFDNEAIASISNIDIKAEDFLYVGNLLTEKDEDSFINEKKINVINAKQIQDNKTLVQSKILDFCNSADFIHITFDIDVFKKDIVSATGTPNPNGFSNEDVEICLKAIVDSKKFFSLDLVEVNPHKENADMTVAKAQEVISRILLA